MEIAAEANQDTDSGLVQILWDKDTTIWDYDHNVFSQVANFMTNCWPVKMLANHVCCSPRLIARFLKPIMYAFMDKPSRSRTLFHDVPEWQILELLSSYGIMKYALPTKMGGNIQLNHSEWIANRRVVELEEI
jgi:hypothetical protein